MSRSSDFHTLDFVRSVRDKHAAMLADMRPEEIIAFFQGLGEPGPEESKVGATSDRRLAGRRLPKPSSADGGARR